MRPIRRRHGQGRGQAGFTLLEVIVATLIMAVAVASLVQALSQSARNTGRVIDHDRAAVLARRKMDELLSMSIWPMGIPMQGQFDSGQVGTTAGWTALVTAPDRPKFLAPGMPVLQRVQLKIWWLEGGVRKEVEVGAYRRATLTDAMLKSLAESGAGTPGVIR